jgi:hypothetical protein
LLFQINTRGIILFQKNIPATAAGCRILLFNSNGPAGNQVKGIYLIKSIISGLDAFHQSGFAESIRDHAAFFHILQNTGGGIIIQSDHIKCIGML